MSERGQQPSKERWDASQIPVSFSLTSPRAESDLGNAGIVRGAPELPLCSHPSPFSALFSASQTGERLRYNASPTPSQLSCHWLHMRNNETSSETRLQKEGGSIWKKKNVLKEGGNCGIKKSRGFCLFLSVAIIFWGVWGSAFLASVSGAGEDLG